MLKLLLTWLLSSSNAPVVPAKTSTNTCTYPEVKNLLKRKYGANLKVQHEIKYLIDCCTEVNGQYIRNCRSYK